MLIPRILEMTLLLRMVLYANKACNSAQKCLMTKLEPETRKEKGVQQTEAASRNSKFFSSSFFFPKIWGEGGWGGEGCVKHE